MVKVTFSLDAKTVERIRRVAAQLGKPQSLVVREAVADYAERSNRLSESERVHLLAVLDRVRRTRSARTASAVDTELRAVRAARRRPGRTHPPA